MVYIHVNQTCNEILQVFSSPKDNRLFKTKFGCPANILVVLYDGTRTTFKTRRRCIDGSDAVLNIIITS